MMSYTTFAYDIDFQKQTVKGISSSNTVTYFIQIYFYTQVCFSKILTKNVEALFYGTFYNDCFLLFL